MTLTDEDIFPFGAPKRAMTKMKDIDKDYLKWFYNQPIKNQLSGSPRDVREYIEKNSEKLGIEIFRKE